MQIEFATSREYHSGSPFKMLQQLLPIYIKVFVLFLVNLVIITKHSMLHAGLVLIQHGLSQVLVMSAIHNACLISPSIMLVLFPSLGEQKA